MASATRNNRWPSFIHLECSLHMLTVGTTNEDVSVSGTSVREAYEALELLGRGSTGQHCCGVVGGDRVVL